MNFELIATIVVAIVTANVINKVFVNPLLGKFILRGAKNIIYNPNASNDRKVES